MKKAIILILIGITFGCSLKKDMVTTKYDNGNIKKKYQHYYDEKTGSFLEDGLYQEWYENGLLRQEVFYKNGQLNGIFKMWHKNGQLQAEGNYKNGELDGLYKSWNENGQLGIEGNYKEGKLDGLYKMWYKNKLQQELKYKNGELIE